MVNFFKNLFRKNSQHSPADYDFMIVGLGNPGTKYLNTRHNIGWAAVQSLAENCGGDEFRALSSIYLQTTISQENKKVLLILPTTYMNNSGEAVKKAASKYGISAENICVVLDEYNFPVGKLHLKKGGGDGGHNGVSSVLFHLNDTSFYRLRCGIGKDFAPGGMANYVLSTFKENEIEPRNKMIEHAVDALKQLITNNPSTAMSDINSGRLWAKEENSVSDS